MLSKSCLSLFSKTFPGIYTPHIISKVSQNYHHNCVSYNLFWYDLLLVRKNIRTRSNMELNNIDLAYGSRGKRVHHDWEPWLQLAGRGSREQRALIITSQREQRKNWEWVRLQTHRAHSTGWYTSSRHFPPLKNCITLLNKLCHQMRTNC